MVKKTAKKIVEFKNGAGGLSNAADSHSSKKITALTAYDYSSAKYFDEAGVDIILVGDSLGQVILGYPNTTHVTLDDMKIFTGAVARGVQNALVVTDMPFLTYQASIESAVNNAAEIIRAGANALKLEGGSDYIVNTVKHLVENGVPVMAHLGFTPQFINTIGGNFVAGKSLDATLEILEQAKKLEKAGAFAIVLEMVPTECAKYITENLTIPTIGIGAGVYCDGQILVSDDILGRFDGFTPKFARKYTDLKSAISDCAKKYCEDIEKGAFPNKDESFYLGDEERKRLEDFIKNQRG